MPASQRKVASELPQDCGAEAKKWSQFGEDFFFKDFLGSQKELKTSSEDSEPTTEFFDELKPLLLSMKAFGLFPLQRRNSDESNFRRCKLSLLYSILFYIGMSLYAFYVSRVRIEYLRSSETQFDELLFSVVHFLYVLPHFYLIPCHWIEVTKVGRYFTHWYEFQNQFQHVTGKPLYLGQRKNALLSVVLIPIVSVIYIVTELLLVNPKHMIWEIGFYFYITVIISLHIGWWWVVCSALQGAMDAFNRNLFKDCSIFKHETSAVMVAEYRSLWITICKLSRETGYFMCYTYGHLTIFAFAIMTLQLYGALSNLNDGMYPRHAGLAITVLLTAVMIYTIANSAHHASDQISDVFSERLSRVCTTDKQVRRELKIFSQVISVNSPAINLGGYARMDRGFLLNFASQMVTYLIVLLQFRLGILSLNPSSNSTEQTTHSSVSQLLK